MKRDDSRPLIVVPCYNEECRLDSGRFLELARTGLVRLHFVDDGSTDATGLILDRMAGASEAITTSRLTVNSGKGEAVRHGLLHALRAGAPIVGYYDADLATPPSELLRLIDTLQTRPSVSVVLGARVARLGSSIEREPFRHYIGRLYASLASLALGVRVYDTQCGAKLFRSSPLLLRALQEPFPSCWAFDVSLIDRLRKGTASLPGLPIDSFLEEPLQAWRAVDGSKVSAPGALKAFAHLSLLALKRLRPAPSHDGTSGDQTNVVPVPLELQADRLTDVA